MNEVICHGIPDQYELQYVYFSHFLHRDGDIVNIDVSAFHDGFHGDLNKTCLVGNVDDAGQHLVKETRACLDLAIAECRPGVAYRDLGAVIQRHATASGLSVVVSVNGNVNVEDVLRTRDQPVVPLRTQCATLRQEQGCRSDEAWTHFYNRTNDL